MQIIDGARGFEFEVDMEGFVWTMLEKIFINTGVGIWIIFNGV